MANQTIADALVKAGVAVPKTHRVPAKPRNKTSTSSTSVPKKPRAPRKPSHAQQTAQLDREIESLISYMHR